MLKVKLSSHKKTKLLLATTSLLFADLAMSSNAPSYRISQFFGTGQQADLVVIDGGRYEGIASGDVFRVYRPSATIRDAGMTIETGEAKAIMVYDHTTVARITVQSTPLSQSVFPRFSQVMAGDLVVKQHFNIRPTVAIAEDVEIFYADLFEDPRSNPKSFDLNDSAKTTLSKRLADLAKLKSSRLMVIAHTDENGPAEANQIESLQRALVIRQFLIDHLGFDPNRVSAIGKGEDDLPEGNLTPGASQRARRIVFKIIPENSESTMQASKD
jgi:outer membrane protein OmpA-like peptidoglycan-associated protein